MLHGVRGIIGDLGDTIISGRPMVRALQLSIKDVMGVNICEKTIYNGFGMPKHQQIAELIQPHYRQVSHENINKIHDQFEQRLCDYYNKHGVKYLPGTELAIQEFARRNIRFACTTGLSSRIVQNMYDKFPLYRPVPVVTCQRPSTAGITSIMETWNKGVPPSQRISHEHCVKVGDSMSDFEEAQLSGLPFIGIVGHRPDGAVVGAKMYHKGVPVIVTELNDVINLLDSKIE